MKQFKGYAEGQDFKGTLKYGDFINLQDSVIDSINEIQEYITVASGLNLTTTTTGLVSTPGIINWGGYPASMEATQLPSDQCYIVIASRELDERTIPNGVGASTYFAYVDYIAVVSTTIPDLGVLDEDWNGLKVGDTILKVLPYLYRTHDCIVNLTQMNDLQGNEGDVVNVSGVNGIVRVVGTDKYFQVQGAYTNTDLQSQLGGYIENTLLVFGGDQDINNVILTLRDEESTQLPLPRTNTLNEMLSQMTDILNRLKTIAFTSNYNDLDVMLEDVSQLQVTLSDQGMLEVPMSGTVSLVLSRIKAWVDNLKEVAVTGQYNDLTGVPTKLSDFENDLVLATVDIPGEIRMIGADVDIPEGWQLADGTNGTLDMEGYLPYGATDSVPVGTEVNVSGTAGTAIKARAVKFIQKLIETLHSLNVTVVNSASGTVGLTPLGGYTNLSKSIVEGQSISIYAVTKQNMKFGGWSGSTTSTANPLVISPTADVNLTATFITTYQKTLSCNKSGYLVQIGEGSTPTVGPAASVVLWTELAYTVFCQAPKTEHYLINVTNNGTVVPTATQPSTGQSGYIYIGMPASAKNEAIVFKYGDKVLIKYVLSQGSGTINVDSTNVTGQSIYYVPGTSKSITFTPSANYRFDHLRMSVNGATSTNNPYAATFQQNTEVQAFFIGQYTLAVQSANSAQGTISIDGAAASASQSKVVDDGSSHSLTATPTAAYNFASWTQGGNAISTTNPYNVSGNFTIGGTRTILANFTIKQFNVTLMSPSLESTAINGCTSSGGGTVNYGASTTLSASAIAGAVFGGWYRDGWSSSKSAESTANPYTVTNITQARTYQARFNLASYTVTVTSNNTAYGSVAGGGSKKYASSVTVTASPAANCRFLRWVEGSNTVSSSASYAFTMPANNRTLQAVFERIMFTITATACAGNCTVTGGGSIQQNSSCTLTATPSANYRFTGWYENSALVSSANPYTFNVTANRSICAKVALNNVTISASSCNTGQGTVSGGGSYTIGSSCTLRATPTASYNFGGWWTACSGGSNQSNFNPWTFTVSAALTTYARFSIKSFTITANKDNGVSSVTGAGNYQYGATCNLSASIYTTWYTFRGWFEGSSQVSTAQQYSFTVTGSRTLTAQTLTKSVNVSIVGCWTVPVVSANRYLGIPVVALNTIVQNVRAGNPINARCKYNQNVPGIVGTTTLGFYRRPNVSTTYTVSGTDLVVSYTVDAQDSANPNWICHSSVTQKPSGVICECRVINQTMYPISLTGVMNEYVEANSFTGNCPMREGQVTIVSSNPSISQINIQYYGSQIAMSAYSTTVFTITSDDLWASQSNLDPNWNQEVVQIVVR